MTHKFVKCDLNLKTIEICNKLLNLYFKIKSSLYNLLTITVNNLSVIQVYAINRKSRIERKEHIINEFLNKDIYENI